MQVDESGNMIIARILGGSTAARQGLLRVGEVILEVNSKQVRNPDELQQAIQDAKENLSLKVAPGIASDGNRSLKSTVSDWIRRCHTVLFLWLDVCSNYYVSFHLSHNTLNDNAL